jgi:cytochrome b involved in lipid metabolism
VYLHLFNYDVVHLFNYDVVGGGVFDVAAFYGWLLSRGYTEDYARYLTRCVREHLRDYLSGNVAALLERKSQNFLAAGSALFRFLGRYDVWRELLHKHGVSWKKRGSTYFLGLILGRSNLVDALLTWMDAVKQRFPWERWFAVAFLGLSGLRLGEGLKVLSMVAEGRLDEMYNPDLGALELWRFKVFLRMSKKAFLVPISEKVYDILSSWRFRMTKHMLVKPLKKWGLPIKLGELRKLHATLLRRGGLMQEEVDILEGRVPPTIFAKHYLALNLKDLCCRAKEVLQPYEERWLS